MIATRTYLSASKHAGAAAWIVIAFGLLVAGLMAGAIVGIRVGSWIIPFGGFVGYVLAFRQGLLAWSRGGIDGIWRDGFRAPPEPDRFQEDRFQEEAPSRPRVADESARSSLIRGRFPTRSDHVRGTLPHA
jgi:hypothetical protein